jgi:glutamate synthase domain-containing protein 2/glutamate synthase domain-containing protein 1/glutamate synthase domain-containing protein 3
MRQHRQAAFADHDACGVGFVVQLGSAGSREVVERGLTALLRLSHRGGVDADGASGDGAGLLIAIPQKFVRERARESAIHLPQVFGMGMVSLPPEQQRQSCAAIEQSAEKTGLHCLGWRTVPTDAAILGPRARATLPAIQQCFFAAKDPASDLERLLFLFRKRAEAETPCGTYFCSLSSRTVVYKGLLAPRQLPAFYADLASPDFASSLAVFHQRYSTNTQPSWHLAQPFRFVAHNGEINTLSGNRRWLRARQAALRRQLGVGDWFRALEEGVSDSASFDNAFEISVQNGYSLPAAMLRMVPPAWESDGRLEASLRDYLQQQAQEHEPWDGPAALAFADGRTVGAKLDRNGLRPLRYTLTSDGLLVVGSEAGLADLRGKRVAERGRLGPGEMLLVDVCAGKIFRGNAFSDMLPQNHSRTRGMAAVRLAPTSIVSAVPTHQPKRVAAALGWTEDQFRLLFQPLALEAKEATWSMGDDAPPAFLSAAQHPLWDYCKQCFAQVTNPPIDPLREPHVMSLEVYLGPRIALPSPVLDGGQLAALEAGLLGPVRRIDFTFPAASGVRGALEALAPVQKEAAEHSSGAPGMVCLSDRGVDAERAALPALLALAAAWKALVQAGGCDVPLVVESGQVVETHHVALLIAAGASAVFPYLALELAESLQLGAAASCRRAVEVGLRKVIARMGISTIASYRNSQLFEIVGLNPELCAEFFEDAASVLGGKGLRGLLEDSLERHARAFAAGTAELQDAGLYRFRQGGERHANAPELVRRIHRYVQTPTAENYRFLADWLEKREPVTIRDLLEIVPGRPTPLEQVEDETRILARFSTQAMSLGALGPEAHRTLARAMNRLGARSNTGEGGEDPALYRSDPEAANRVKQVASARFGVTTEYLAHADELEIKMAQGSKPGEGGQLPAAKVTPYIARLRHAVPGMSLISPPPHHDIYSIEDLAQLIYDLRAVNPRARIGVKLVAGAGVGIIAAGVAKAGADVITICGFDGGTGASPLTSIKNTGLPWEVGLREAHCALVRMGFRQRVRLRTDGGFKFGRDVIVAALLGADEFGFGTAALLAIGCVMARQCHLNTCPTGIATQEEKFRARFAGKPEMVIAYFRGVAQEVRERLAALGARSVDEIVGRVDRLRPRPGLPGPRTTSAATRLGRLLEPAPLPPAQIPGSVKGDSGIPWQLARRIAIAKLPRTRSLRFAIANSDRSVGAHLSGEILRRFGTSAPEDKTIACEFRGTAGQSFGAFLVPGVRFRLWGEANDYVGKGLSGGRIAITAGREASRRGDVLVGNTLLYGATSGELYVAGRAGERFAVRNSGATAVVEGVGQHACEYMTAGVVVILGPAGINLGSGMTGGLAYILRDPLSDECYARGSVRPAPINAQEERWLHLLLDEHLKLTGSPRARRLLRAGARLTMVRLEPINLPCSIEQTWAPTLARLERRGLLPVELPDTLGSSQPVEATS